MATLRELKGRIGSVVSSEKITGAMKMISSAKMHKAEQSMKRLLPYRTLIEGIMGNLLGSDAEFQSPLSEKREVERLAIVIFGSDDGLCGAYNTNLYKQLIGHVSEARNGGVKSIEIIPVGSKMGKAVKKLDVRGVTIREPEGVNSKSTGEEVKRFLDGLTGDYESGKYDRVDLLYMNFLSISRQRPKYEQLLPLNREGEAGTYRPMIFEPSAEAIFVKIIPMYLLAVLQEVFVENRASEQAARVMAMQSANDNAKKLLEQLRLEYNKLRQQSITSELLDIVGGQIR